jgi:excisionase family DNA binding protein
VNRLTLELPQEFVEAVAERAAALVLERLEARTASPYLSVEEAAEYLRCSPQRIYDLRSSRRLTRGGDGSRALVLRSELDELVARELPPASQTVMNTRTVA